MYWTGFIFSLIGLGFIRSAESQMTLNTKGNAQLATNLGISMAGKFEIFSGYDVMLSTYQKSEERREFEIKRKDVTVLVQKMADDLSKMLKKKQRAVKRLVDVLEEKSKTFNWSDDIDVPYYNVEFLNSPLPEEDEDEYQNQRKMLNLTKDTRFLNRPINTNQSVVQVPFDVYSKGNDILRGVKWSKALDDQFKENVRLDPTLKWQYFGSVEGFMRVYPGFQWKMMTPYERPNVYDCRSRNWYTEAATYPKDMIILVDGSGSMKGLKKSIAAHVVKTLLNTLGDNDFVNVLTYSDEVHYVEPCFNGTLVRADDNRKERMIDAFKHSNTSNIANLANALNESFNLLLDFHSSGSGSDCYSSIMIITDGATDNYQEVMDKYMNMTKRQIRIFSYLIGADKAYLKPVRDIACNNHGFFHQVESRNDVSEKVLHYLTVMNRPQAIKEDHHTIWTKPYYDRTNLDLGFKLITTVATPVYLHKKWNNPKMLGVAATDVPVSSMLDAINLQKTGVNGYVFIVTNNGYVVTHPRLDTFFSTEYHQDKIKSNYNSIDIDDLEGSAVNDTIRDSLLKRIAGQNVDRTVTIPLDEWKRAIPVQGNYYYAPISSAPFILGIFLPIGYGVVKIDYANSLKARRNGPTYTDKECDQVNSHLMGHYRNRESPNRNSAICSLNNSDVMVAEKWKYCKTKDGSVLKSRFGRDLTQFDQIKMFFFGKNDNLDCDMDLLTGLLYDVLSTSALFPIWKEQSVYKNTTREGIVMVFVMTSSGMSRQYWHRDPTSGFQNIKITLSSFDRQSFPSFYRRAAGYPEGNVWIYTMLDSDNPRTQSDDLLAVQALRKNGSVLGVIGIVIKNSHFNQKFWDDVTSQSLTTDCSQNPDSQYTCFVIDENAIIILSSSDAVNDTGQPLNFVDEQATSFLLTNNIFYTLNTYDRGTMCVMKQNDNGSGGSAISRYLTNPFRSVSSYMTFWTKEFSMILARVMISNLWSLIFNSGEADAEFSATIENSEHYRVCDMKYTILTVDNKMIPYQNASFCAKNCTRQISIQRINQSNLYLLIVENIDKLQCDCQNVTSSVKLGKEEVTYEGGDKCKRLRDHKLGRKTEGCDNHHKNKKSGQIGSLQCERNSGFSVHRSRWIKTTKKNSNNKNTLLIYSYFILSISWFLPYILFNVLNLSETLHIPGLV